MHRRTSSAALHLTSPRDELVGKSIGRSSLVGGGVHSDQPSNPGNSSSTSSTTTITTTIDADPAMTASSSSSTSPHETTSTIGNSQSASRSSRRQHSGSTRDTRDRAITRSAHTPAPVPACGVWRQASAPRLASALRYEQGAIGRICTSAFKHACLGACRDDEHFVPSQHAKGLTLACKFRTLLGWRSHASDLPLA
jgi:hypothetical protein